MTILVFEVKARFPMTTYLVPYYNFVIFLSITLEHSSVTHQSMYIHKRKLGSHLNFVSDKLVIISVNIENFKISLVRITKHKIKASIYDGCHFLNLNLTS